MSALSEIELVKEPGVSPAERRFVFLVEDDCDDAELLVEAFRELSPSYTVVCLNSADQLFSRLNAALPEDMPCLIITDLNIPIVNGISILNQLARHERYSSIPRIVYSHSSNPQDQQSSFNAGARIYLRKPNTIAEIRRNVLQMLEYCN